MDAELRTVASDGTTTSEPLSFEDITPEHLAAWAAEQEAWEEYCARKARG